MIFAREHGCKKQTQHRSTIWPEIVMDCDMESNGSSVASKSIEFYCLIVNAWQVHSPQKQCKVGNIPLCRLGIFETNDI